MCVKDDERIGFLKSGSHPCAYARRRIVVLWLCPCIKRFNSLIFPRHPKYMAIQKRGIFLSSSIPDWILHMLCALCELECIEVSLTSYDTPDTVLLCNENCT